MSRDLEEKQTTCQQLQTSADELEVQIDSLSEERQRVRLYLHLNATSYLPLLFPLPFPLLLSRPPAPPPPLAKFSCFIKIVSGRVWSDLVSEHWRNHRLFSFGMHAIGSLRSRCSARERVVRHARGRIRVFRYCCAPPQALARMSMRVLRHWSSYQFCCCLGCCFNH